MKNPNVWEYTNIPLSIPERPRGVLINVSGLQTWNPKERAWAIGGAGQGVIGAGLQLIFNQEAEFDVGNVTRRAIAEKYQIVGRVEDKVLVEKLALMTAANDYSIDYLVDNAALQFALERLCCSNVAVIGTKLLPLLLRRHEEHLTHLPEIKRDFITVMLGVSSKDKKASERKLAAHEYKMKKMGLHPSLTLADVEKNRIRRLREDRKKYKNAYGIQYSRANMEKSVHVVVDNTEDRSTEQMQDLIAEMLEDMSQVYPVLTPFFIDTIANFTL